MRLGFCYHALLFNLIAHSFLTFQFSLRLPYPFHYPSKWRGSVRQILVSLMLVVILMLMFVSLLVVVVEEVAVLVQVQVVVE